MQIAFSSIASGNKSPASIARWLLLLLNEANHDILWSAEQKRDYRVAALVIPVPTPESPRRQAWGYDSTKPLPGKWEAAFLC